MAETVWGWVKHVVSTRGGVGNSMITANREGGEGALAGLSVEVELLSCWCHCSMAVEGTWKILSSLDCAASEGSIRGYAAIGLLAPSRMFSRD